MNAFQWIYIVLVSLLICAEMAAILNKQTGDTISESVAIIYGWSPFLAWMMTAFFLWLPVHFIRLWAWPMIKALLADSD